MRQKGPAMIVEDLGSLEPYSQLLSVPIGGRCTLCFNSDGGGVDTALGLAKLKAGP